MAIFQGKSGSPGSPLGLSPLPILEENLWRLVDLEFSQARCPCCHPTSSVKALKETQSTNPNLDLVLSSSRTGLLAEGELLPLQRLSDTRINDEDHPSVRTSTTDLGMATSDEVSVQEMLSDELMICRSLCTVVSFGFLLPSRCLPVHYMTQPCTLSLRTCSELGDYSIYNTHLLTGLSNQWVTGSCSSAIYRHPLPCLNSVSHTHSEWTTGTGEYVSIPWVSDYGRWWVYDRIPYQVK